MRLGLRVSIPVQSIDPEIVYSCLRVHFPCQHQHPLPLLTRYSSSKEAAGTEVASRGSLTALLQCLNRCLFLMIHFISFPYRQCRSLIGRRYQRRPVVQTGCHAGVGFAVLTCRRSAYRRHCRRVLPATTSVMEVVEEVVFRYSLILSFLHFAFRSKRVTT